MTGRRALFEVPGPGPYLLAHSVGCLPRRARALLEKAFFAPWVERGSDGWPDWLAAVDAFRGALAPLLGGGIDEVCPQPSVSAALAAIVTALPRRPGRDVLLASAHSFPSIGFALGACARLGYRLELIDEALDPGDPQTWLDAIDERVAAVVPMHVHSNTGVVAPVAAIAAAARAQGAATIVDICQSVGIVPVDLAGWGVDAAVGSSVKWLCGGPGAAFLWVRRDLIASLQPLSVGWFSHAEPFAFDIRDFRHAPDARRFWGGTPSVAPFVLATAGIALIADIGVAEAQRHNRALVGALAEAADTTLDMAGRGGTLCLTGEDPDAIAAALAGIGAGVDRRGAAVRLSFHLWNHEGEARLVGERLRGHAVRLVDPA